jgi:hypothetical protein
MSAVLVFLGGEGRNELGKLGLAIPPSKATTTPGVIKALLVRTRPMTGGRALALGSGSVFESITDHCRLPDGYAGFSSAVHMTSGPFLGWFWMPRSAALRLWLLCAIRMMIPADLRSSPTPSIARPRTFF